MNNKQIIYILLGIIIFILLWCFISIKINSEIIFPNIFTIIKKLGDILLEKSFYKDLMYSIVRVFVAFILSFLSAFLFGVLSGIFLSLRYILMPIINFIRTIPTIPLIVVAVIWVDNNTVPIFVSMLVIFPIIYDAITNGIINVDKNLIEKANNQLRKTIVALNNKERECAELKNSFLNLKEENAKLVKDMFKYKYDKEQKLRNKLENLTTN